MKAIDIPQHTRKLVYERDKHCRLCGSVNNLHIHHIIYRSSWRNGHEPFNLILLCERCHRTVHSDKHHWQFVLLNKTITGNEVLVDIPDHVVQLIKYCTSKNSGQSWELNL